MIQSQFKIVLAKKETRDDRTYSMLEIAEQTGAEVATIGAWNTNNMQAIGLGDLTGLCEFFDCQPGDLLRYVGDGEKGG